MDWLRSGPQAEGTQGGVQLAGDPERAARAQRHVDGIDIDAQTWQELVAAGRKVGFTVPS